MDFDAIVDACYSPEEPDPIEDEVAGLAAEHARVFARFRDAARDVDDLEEVTDEIGHAGKRGRAYPGGLWALRIDHDRGEDWFAMFGRDGWRTPNLDALERRLFEHALALASAARPPR